MKNAISWFELPVLDLPRAQRFYEALLGAPLRAEVFAGLDMAIFPYQGGVGGALVHGERFRPSPDGAVVYLDVGDALDACLGRVGAAGGKVVMPRTDIGEPGFIAMILDPEGNRVGLHQARGRRG